MFLPLLYDSGKITGIAAVSAAAFTKGNACKDNGSGYLTPSEAGDNTDVHFVALQTLTIVTSGDLIVVIRTKDVVFLADTDANPAQTDVGTEADLASAATVDPDASTDDVFYIESIRGAVSDKKVIGWFTQGVPNS